MRSGKTGRFVAGVAAILCLCAMAAGDTLMLHDGRVLTGRFISRDSKSVVFEMHKFGSKITMTLPASDVKSLVKGEIKPGETASKPPSKPARRKIGQAPPLAPAPLLKKYPGPTYYVIPLNGVVGKNMVADVLAKSFADAAKRKPTVVVLHVDSPGGMIAEVEKLAAEIRKQSSGMKVVVLVRKALSAAAITSLACKDIYMEPAGVFGAATAFRMAAGHLPVAIQEKVQSVWRATARSCAEIGGHNTLLAEAMIDAQVELRVVDKNGKKTVVTGPGEKSLSRRGRLLTLTAGEAQSCGLSRGTVEGAGGPWQGAWIRRLD